MTGFLAHPDVAYVLFLLGIVGLVAEAHHPGIIVPGAVGIVALVMALIGFIALPVSWPAALLLLLSLGLLVAELKTEGIGVFGAAALVSFIAGSLLLYEGPGIGVSAWVVGITGAGLGGFLAFVLRAIRRARRLVVTSGAEGLIGREATVERDLLPSGRVRLEGETWRAVSIDGHIPRGTRVMVVEVEGVTLRVVKEE